MEMCITRVGTEQRERSRGVFCGWSKAEVMENLSLEAPKCDFGEFCVFVEWQEIYYNGVQKARSREKGRNIQLEREEKCTDSTGNQLNF